MIADIHKPDISILVQHEGKCTLTGWGCGHKMRSVAERKNDITFCLTFSLGSPIGITLPNKKIEEFRPNRNFQEMSSCWKLSTGTDDAFEHCQDRKR